MTSYIPMFADPAYWRKKRAENIEGGRKCRATLTDPKSYWRYSPEDERVKKAVAYWVARARHCHDIALRRKPVLHNFIFIGGGMVCEGPLYATESGKGRDA